VTAETLGTHLIIGNAQSATARSAEPIVLPGHTRVSPAVRPPYRHTRQRRRVEFRQLTTFLAIAEELHFGRAAARLHLAQSSVSQQLQRLEREIGVRLVARTSHDVRLTAAGLAFRTEAERLVEQAARAAEVARDVVAGRHGTINIGYNQVAGQWVLPATLLRLHEDYPNLVVHLWERLTGALLEALATGELDVALVYGRPPAPRFRSRYILDLPLVAAAPDGHPWAGREQARFAELASVPCVLPRRDRSPAVYDAVVSTAARIGIDLCVVDEIDDPSAMGIVARTQQVIVFTSAARVKSAMPNGLVGVPIVDPVPMLAMYAAWRPTADTHVVDAFLASLHKAGPHRWQGPAPGGGTSEPPHSELAPPRRKPGG
jgi:DNA-binding transcriptional LysR family regulator